MPAVKRMRSLTPSRPVKKLKYRDTAKTSTLGNIGGKVSRNMTTLNLAKGPFASKKFMTFLYENELTAIPSANVNALSVMSNSLFDFDQTSTATFGNKQPLYYDALMSASGPYKQYKVISWKTTYTILNQSTAVPITVWAIPPISATSEIDSAAEADNFPGSKSLYLGPVGSSKNMGTVTIYGHTDDVYAAQAALDTLAGAYNANPLSPCYQGLIIKGSDGTTAPLVYVAVRHEAYTELGVVDSLVS